MYGIYEVVVFSLTVLLSSAAPVDELPAKQQVDAPQDQSLFTLLDGLRTEEGAISGIFDNFEAFPTSITARRGTERSTESCCSVHLRGVQLLKGGFGHVKPLGGIDAATGAFKGAALPRRQSTNNLTSISETRQRTYQLAER